MEHKRIRIELCPEEAIRERLLRDEREAKARTAAAAERAMPLQAVGEWIESLASAGQTLAGARSRAGARAKQDRAPGKTSPGAPDAS